ncbi:MAG: adenylate kinase family protein [Candidatus Thermoplasmatota archaeon]|nr:adenylate kinase family protein [Candidatus Thermoplasmatota archaeon]
MLIAVSGTPGVGKTSLCRELEIRGLTCRNLLDMIIEKGLPEGGSKGSDEVLVDTGRLMSELEKMDLGGQGDIVLDGHLSYLSPSDTCLVLRLHPEDLKLRLMGRGYAPEKVRENVEAEAVSVVLVEAMGLETRRLACRPWTELPRGCGVVFEIDATARTVVELADDVMRVLRAYRRKRLNELADYRPGRVDWLEVFAEWC